MRIQVEKIVRAIKPSLRWKAFHKVLFWEWLSKFDLKRSGIADLKLLNEIEELCLGFISFTDMESRQRKKIESVFKQFIKEIGLKSYDQLLDSLSGLVDIERRLEKKPRLYQEEQVAQLESELGLKEGTLVLWEERLDTIRLSDIHKSIVPIFFGGRPGIGIGVQRQPLAMFNIPQRLCFALDKPRQEIIEGMYKGLIFEEYLCNVLRGELVIAIDPSDPLGGYHQRADRLQSFPGGKELLDELERSSEVPAWEKISREPEYYISEPELTNEEMRLIRPYRYLRYKYRLPDGQNSCRVVIGPETHPSSEAFLKAENKDEWEEDLLLLHEHEPKHCLVAQCKFTVKYSHNKYREGRNHVKKFADYLEETPSAKLELNVPEDFVLLPVLFTSFTGAIHKQDDGVLKTAVFPVMLGQFFLEVSNFLQILSN